MAGAGVFAERGEGAEEAAEGGGRALVEVGPRRKDEEIGAEFLGEVEGHAAVQTGEERFGRNLEKEGAGRGRGDGERAAGEGLGAEGSLGGDGEGDDVDVEDMRHRLTIC